MLVDKLQVIEDKFMDPRATTSATLKSLRVKMNGVN